MEEGGREQQMRSKKVVEGKRGGERKMSVGRREWLTREGGEGKDPQGD